MTEEEKIELRLRSFDFAIRIKPNGYVDSATPLGNQRRDIYSVDQLIKDADKIYESLIK